LPLSDRPACFYFSKNLLYSIAFGQTRLQLLFKELNHLAAFGQARLLLFFKKLTLFYRFRADPPAVGFQRTYSSIYRFRAGPPAIRSRAGKNALISLLVSLET